MCHNSRSITKKVWQYDLLFSNLDFICISESWLHPGIQDHQVCINDMTLFRQDRDHTVHDIEEEEGGGVACYVSSKYVPFTRRLDDLCKVNRNIEALTLAVTSPVHKYKLVITVYRPPRGNVKEFFRELSDIIVASEMSTKEIWICGDMNVNSKHRNSPKYKKALTFLRKNHLKHLPTGCTRLHPKGATTIDHIYTSKGQYVASGNVNEFLSDHIPIFAIYKKTRNQQHRKKIMGRSYKGYSKDNLIDHVAQSISENDLENLDADGLAILLIESISSYLDKECPIREFIVPEEDRPWVCDEIREMIKDRHSALKRAKDHHDPDVVNPHLKEARRLRQSIDKKGRANMSKIIKDKLAMYRKNPKKFWAELNKLWKGKRNTPIISLQDEISGEVITPELTADYVNDFFCNVGSNLAEPFVQAPGNYSRYEAINTLHTEEVTGLEVDNNLRFDEISDQTLKYVVEEIEIGKSSGLEDMRSHVVKDTMVGNIQIWTSFINLCITTCVFPDVLKLGTIIPLPKSGNLRSVLNWRPITLLPIIGKVIEKVLHRQLMYFIEENDIMNKNQFGFLPNRSTAMAILKLVNVLFSARNQGEFVMTVFLDIKKAFDVVHHGRLLMKLKDYGLSISALKLIASYLDSRHSCTMANNVRCNPQRVEFGVPQGSVLGPLLFLFYINDLPNVVQHCTPILYADDLVLLSRGKDPDTVRSLLQADLDRVHSWCKTNRLTPNIGKTKSMWFIPDIKSDRVQNMKVDLDGFSLGETKEFKYLGIWLDRALTFTETLGVY